MTDVVVRLREVESPVWTLESLAHARKYREAYGLHFTDQEMDQEEELIRVGKPDPRAPPDATVFEVLLDDVVVGEVVMAARNPPEIDLAIYDRHAGVGIGRKSIELLLDELADRCVPIVRARVRDENPYREKVLHLLHELGFEEHSSWGSVCDMRRSTTRAPAGDCH